MKSETAADYQSRILRAVNYIQLNLDRDLPLEELARLACFSPFHFHRVFRGITGEGLAEFVRRLKLERAALALRGSDRSVTELALDAGYESPEAFARAFRQRFGSTPSEYRRSITEALNFGIQAFQSISGAKTMKAELKKVGMRRIAYVRHVGPYAECGKAWGKLCGWAEARRMITPQTQFIGICYDDPEVTPAEKIRYDACMTVPESVQGGDGVEVTELAAGEFATTIHQGPMERLKFTYAALCGQWIPEHKREPVHGPSIEIYLNDPNQVKPEEILIEVQVPVTRRP